MPRTQASDPGEISASLLVYARHYWTEELGNLALIVGFLILGPTVGPLFYVLAAFPGLLVLLSLVNGRRIFRHGCLNPGLIVSTSPPLYATLTDLTRCDAPFPAVRVIKKRFAPVVGDFAEGTRLATVADYDQGEPQDRDLPHWVGFMPRPVDCGTRDPEVVQRSLARLAPEEWAKLERAIEQLPRPLKPGITPVFVEQTAWRDGGNAQRLRTKR